MDAKVGPLRVRRSRRLWRERDVVEFVVNLAREALDERVA